jgi:hypothetical protein
MRRLLGEPWLAPAPPVGPHCAPTAPHAAARTQRLDCSKSKAVAVRRNVAA